MQLYKCFYIQGSEFVFYRVLHVLRKLHFWPLFPLNNYLFIFLVSVLFADPCLSLLQSAMSRSCLSGKEDWDSEVFDVFLCHWFLFPSNIKDWHKIVFQPATPSPLHCTAKCGCSTCLVFGFIIIIYFLGALYLAVIERPH